MSEPAPLWFGPTERPLFGWLHAPEGGRARAGVVLCPPTGYEAVCAHRTMRVVAERLAAMGIAALRFDYDGTGDSAGAHDDPDRVPAWLASVDRAVELLRQAGAPAVAAVGMRLGATLAAAADVDALVLWDPVWSGRSFVRQLRALQLLGMDGLTGSTPAEDGSLAVAGAVYPAGTATELRALELPDRSSGPAPVLLLHRPDQPAPTKELDRLPPTTDVAEASGQELLFGGPSIEAQVPRAALDRVVAWLDAHLPTGAEPFTPPVGPEQAVLGDVVERFASLADVGLFGVVTERATGAAADAPVLLLLNNSVDHHVGPNRMWVDWGRRMAALGFPVVRVDLSGIGDSPTRPGEPDDHPYGRSSVTDVAAAVRAVDRGAGVVPIGLCSGARNALDAGADLPLRGLCAVNPPVHLARSIIATLSPEDPRPATIERINAYNRYRHHLLLRVPSPVWRVLDRLGLVRSRATRFQRVVDHGTDTLLVYGADDFYLLRVRRDSAWHLRRLAGAANFRLVVVDGLDHGLMAPDGREQVMRHLTEHLVARYAPAP
ncbi:MAG: Alpha/beta hydrolase family protein [Actinomycetia bacterium]|nr:Alpha/beta hydrolase family protein [Actinomycetes bacterium]